MRSDEAQIGFLQGVAYAAAQLIRMHDQPGMAENLLDEAGLTYEDYEHVSEDDLAVLRVHLSDLPPEGKCKLVPLS